MLDTCLDASAKSLTPDQVPFRLISSIPVSNTFPNWILNGYMHFRNLSLTLCVHHYSNSIMLLLGLVAAQQQHATGVLLTAATPMGSLFSWIITCWLAECGFSCPGGLSGIVVSSLSHQAFLIRLRGHFLLKLLYRFECCCERILGWNIQKTRRDISCQLCVPCKDISNTFFSGRPWGYCCCFHGVFTMATAIGFLQRRQLHFGTRNFRLFM